MDELKNCPVCGTPARMLVHDGCYSVEPIAHRWIPVEERLPENYVSVIGYLPNENKAGFPPTREVFRMDTGWVSPALGELCIVTHWMPMPEPPEEVKIDGNAQRTNAGAAADDNIADRGRVYAKALP